MTTKSRRLGHAHTLPTAPAFSFGGRHQKSQGDAGPGPGEYGVDLNWKNKGSTFGSGTRYKTPSDPQPCGQDYSTDKSYRHTLRSAAGYSIAGASRPDHKTGNPGPGAYNGDEARGLVKPNTPAASMARRHNDGSTAQPEPGPGKYSPRTPRGMSVSLKFRHPEAAPGRDGPGPAGYNLRPQSVPSGGKSFGVSRSMNFSETGFPGPGTYTGPDEAVRGHRAAWSIGLRLASPRGAQGPGPGAYSNGMMSGYAGRGLKSEHLTAPAFSMPGRPGSAFDPMSPAGTDYRPLDSMRRSAPAFSFRGTTEKDGKAFVPGPGAYENPAVGMTYRNSPGISVGARHEDGGVAHLSPGPQVYTLPKPPGKAAVTLKFRHSVDKIDPGPSPAEYDVVKMCGGGDCHCSTCPAKGFSFGHKPPVDRREDVPGPMYQVGVSTLGVAGAPRMEPVVMERNLIL